MDLWLVVGQAGCSLIEGGDGVERQDQTDEAGGERMDTGRNGWGG